MFPPSPNKNLDMPLMSNVEQFKYEFILNSANNSYWVELTYLLKNKFI